MSDNERNAYENKETNREDRWQTAKFVSVFVIVVLTLLAGYRYAGNTRANDWYLFQVARHTAWTLDMLFHESTLEFTAGSDQVTPQRKRAAMKAWAGGRKNPTKAEIEAAPDGSLTAWERFSYRAARSRHLGKGRGEVGPSVRLLLIPDLRTRIKNTEADLAAARKNPSLSEERRKKRVAKLEADLAELREQTKAPRQSRSSRRDRGYLFTFSVVSECGAIEVMAIFLAAVLAFPAAWWKKLLGIGAGLPLMYVVNVLRIACLGVIGGLDGGREWFEFSHYYAWQAIYIVFVVAVWLVWIEFLVRRTAWADSMAAGVLRPGSKANAVLAFSARFILYVVILEFLWWQFLPIYGYALVQTAGAALKYVFGLPITAAYVETAGLMNTDSSIVFELAGGQTRTLPMLALLVTNLPPYLALVTATVKLSRLRRLRIALYGTAILVSTHFAHVTLVMRYQETLQRLGEIPYAVIQFYLTLPFLLWIVFAVLAKTPAKDQSASAAETGEETPGPAAPETEKDGDEHTHDAGNGAD